MLKYPACLLIAALLLACCASIEDSVRTPLIGFGNIEAEYHFDTAQTSWDAFRLPDDAAYFAVTDGALTGSVVGDRGYIWSLNKPKYSDISIKANLQQIRGSSGNGF